MFDIFGKATKVDRVVQTSVECEVLDEASRGNDAQEYVGTILNQVEIWQFVGRASHSFVRRKNKVEKAFNDDNALTVDITKLEEAVALSGTFTFTVCQR